MKRYAEVEPYIPSPLEDWDEAFKTATGEYPAGSPLIGRLPCAGQCGGFARWTSNYCHACWSKKPVPTGNVWGTW